MSPYLRRRFSRHAVRIGRHAKAAMDGVPSPLGMAVDAYADFKAHTAHVRAVQDDFQAFLGDLGIQRLERQTANETMELYYQSRPRQPRLF